MKFSIEEQLRLINKGTVEVISESELKPKLEKSLATKTPLRVKLGADPSRPDIHLGHTVQLYKLKQFQDHGHTVIFIIGDFTGMIGDPSCKDSERPMLSEEEVRENSKSYFEQVGKIIDLDKAEILYNSSWLAKLNFIDVIKLASHYTVARMLERDDFEKRYTAQKSISIQEFLYPLAQAYDSVAIHADIELGGTDQKFNFLLTRDIQKAYGQNPEVIILNPLLVGLDGVQKMSKSLNNYIGINEAPNEMFGKIMSISDELMLNYYELLTDFSRIEIQNSKKHPMELKKELAEIIVERFHSKKHALDAREYFEKVFSKKENPDTLIELPLSHDDLKEGKIWIINLLKKTNTLKSNSEARRLITQGAISINDQKITDSDKDIVPLDNAVLKIGAKKFFRIRLV